MPDRQATGPDCVKTHGSLMHRQNAFNNVNETASASDFHREKQNEATVRATRILQE